MDTSNWWKGLAFGAFSSMVADCLTLPIDVTKTRLQISGAGGTKLYDGIFDCVGKTARNEGVAALWKGLEPALWRQCFYGGLRYGLYGPIKEKLAPGVPKKDLPLSLKILAGGLSGTVSQGLANPCDVVKVRMMAPPGKSGGTNYRWFLQALIQIGKTEGVGGLYKGVTANVSRAASLAAAEMSVYDQVKTKLLHEYEWEEGLGMHAFSATCSGFAAAFASCTLLLSFSLNFLTQHHTHIHTYIYVRTQVRSMCANHVSCLNLWIQLPDKVQCIEVLQIV
jgi:solute carrier family 25 (mitochondrial uncoupling protein), member 8/9